MPLELMILKLAAPQRKTKQPRLARALSEIGEAHALSIETTREGTLQPAVAALFLIHLEPEKPLHLHKLEAVVW